jgi:hypothetical protein
LGPGKWLGADGQCAHCMLPVCCYTPDGAVAHLVIHLQVDRDRLIGVGEAKPWLSQEGAGPQEALSSW